MGWRIFSSSFNFYKRHTGLREFISDYIISDEEISDEIEQIEIFKNLDKNTKKIVRNIYYNIIIIMIYTCIVTMYRWAIFRIFNGTN